MADLPSNMQITQDKMPDLHKALRALADQEVLVGVPDERADRKDPESLGITNASLAYIHDTGMPEQNIPARPFMQPGMKDAEPAAVKDLESLAAGLLSKIGKQPPLVIVDKGLHKVGLRVATSIKKKINEGVPPPLSEYTLRERARRGRKGAKQELANRASGMAPSTQLAKPLIDTGELRNSITYVIRSRKDRKK